jgi:alkylation response protein AidB-like acyl-CoA dehydrogenase
MPDLLADIEPVLPAIASGAASAERERNVSDEIVSRLAAAGVFHMLVPRELGGGEVNPETMLRVIEDVARADASTAWLVMIGSTNAINAAHLQPGIARAIYGDGPGAFTGGIVAPRGKAVPVEGGYKVSGRWTFGSGCKHASWMALNCLVENESGGPPIPFFAQIPASDFAIVDTWDVSGLRATGSHDIEVRDAFVPSGYGYAIAIDRPLYDGVLYGFSIMGLLSVAVASVALGAARGALDDILELAGEKTPMGRRRTISAWNVAQVDLARAEAALRSGRSFLVETIRDICAAIESGGRPSPQQRALLRLASTAAVNGTVQAVDTAYNLGGGSSIYSASPLQRRFRDVHTITQHVMVNQSSLEAAGRALLGLELPPGFL